MPKRDREGHSKAEILKPIFLGHPVVEISCNVLFKSIIIS